jgi:hypothetical protein
MVLFDQPAILNSIGLELSVVGAAWDRGIGALDGPEWHAEVPVVGVCGGACFLRAAALHHTTLLPEQFEIYFDDLDLCLQLWRAGYSVWTCPQAVVRHKFSATMGEGSRARRKYFLNTRNRFWLMARHLPLPTLLRSLPKILLGEVRAVGRSLLDGEAWKVWAHIRAWSSALLYVPEARKYRHEADSSPSGDVWTLVRATPWFCPPISVPVQGCYPAEDRGAAQVTPLAPHATLNIPPGPLQVFASNCYPQAGPVTLSLRFQGQVLHTLHCADQVETTLDTPGGTLTVDSSLDEASEHPSRHDARMVFLRLEQDGTPIAINPDAPWVATQDIAQPSGLADQRR